MPRLLRPALWLTLVTCLTAAETAPAKPSASSEAAAPLPLRYESRILRGWSVMIRLELLTDEKRAETERGLVLIGKQLEDVEREHIRKALEGTDGNISHAARRLGLHRRTLQRKLQRLDGALTQPEEDDEVIERGDE